MPAYIIVVVAACILGCVLHLGLAFILDHSSSRKRPKIVDDLASLLPMSPMLRFANNFLLSSSLIWYNASFSVFPRLDRVACWWVTVFGALLIITPVLRALRPTWSTTAFTSTDGLDAFGVALGASLVAELYARVLWWLFTSSPTYLFPLGSDGARQCATREKKRALGWIMFLLWTGASVTVSVLLEINVDGSLQNREHGESCLACVVLGTLFWDPIYTSLLVALVEQLWYLVPSPISFAAETGVVSPFIFYCLPPESSDSFISSDRAVVPRSVPPQMSAEAILQHQRSSPVIELPKPNVPEPRRMFNPLEQVVSPQDHPVKNTSNHATDYAALGNNLLRALLMPPPTASDERWPEQSYHDEGSIRVRSPHFVWTDGGRAPPALAAPTRDEVL